MTIHIYFFNSDKLQFLIQTTNREWQTDKNVNSDLVNRNFFPHFSSSFCEIRKNILTWRSIQSGNRMQFSIFWHLNHIHAILNISLFCHLNLSRIRYAGIRGQNDIAIWCAHQQRSTMRPGKQLWFQSERLWLKYFNYSSFGAANVYTIAFTCIDRWSNINIILNFHRIEAVVNRQYKNINATLSMVDSACWQNENTHTYTL